MATEKRTPAQDKELESDILKEAGIDSKPDQEAIKEAATTPVPKPIAATTGATAQAGNSEGPKGKPDYMGETSQAGAPATNNGATIINDANFPEYLRNAPPTTLEELEHLAEALKSFRASKSKPALAAVTPKVAPNSIYAERKGIRQYFSPITWAQMGGLKNTDGWVPVVNEPPEVANLKK